MSNKKITITFILMSLFILLGIIGFTAAYFTSSTDFENEFQTGLYQTEATEVFESPQNWMPGDTTPKELTITNTGNVDVKARVCLTEEWTSSNDDTLPNVVNGESMAIINLDNTSNWTKKGNCYEYNDVLEPNDTTSSFIESVTFNPNAEADVECTTSTLNGTTTKECTSTGDGYDNATYLLTLTVETVQANKASELWNPIQYVNRQTENQITTGDEISIGGEHFYVVSSDQNETVLLAKYNLLVGDVFDYDYNYNTGFTLVKTLSSSDSGYGLQNSEAKGYVPLEENETTSRYTGIVPFSGTNYWDSSVCQNTGTNYSCTGTDGLLSDYATNGASYSGSPYPYVYRSNIGNNISPQIVYGRYGYVQNNGYTISYFVEGYKNKLIELGAPNTITGRLLSQEEAVSLGCSESDAFCSNIDGEYSTNGTAPTWVYSSSYWLGSASYSYGVWSVRSGGYFSALSESTDDYNGCRPAIEIPTSELN